ncbi:UDP-2,3-diacylglucosamine diphosphatase [hydrothermal vent metagenome]|uniref:UDP-2,3-diacylglucosamine diphosphatase n=1 Tax=hydrothermal vent metagenome TaxID=652676 RepID=A0A3B0ZN18_9ZZZZ
MPILFISDLHLSAERPDITQAFHHFLQKIAPQSEALYILGDLFEVWLGDDLISPEYHQSISELKKLADRNIPIYIMRGNRDFLFGQQFETLTGAKLIDDPTIIDLYGTTTLLMHGDTLCTDDIKYQEFRAMVRNPAFQADFLSKPPAERVAIAKQLRDTSKSETNSKSEEIMDVNLDTVLDVFSKHKIQNLIHGHTHRPAIHDIKANNLPAKRIVLSDWHDRGSVLVYSESGFQEETINPA